MVKGVLFDVTKGIIEKAGNLAIQEIGLLRSLKDEIKKLNDTVSTISVVLLDAEEQQQHNNQVKVWLNRLKDAIYDADNLLDDISTEALRQGVMTQNKKAKEVRIFFSKSNQLAYGFIMERKIKAMRDRLDAIAKDRGFHLDERHVETQVVGYGMRETYSFERDEEVIGRDYDKDKIIKILLNSNVEESVLILPIVGLGGLGKTTLAQLIFNDEKIQNHFERRLWVCVSNDFEVEKKIEGKRYLLVLDDVWNEDPQKWHSLKDLLKGGARDSKILVTTRDINILAKITQTVRPYMLKGLDDEKSWSLFKRFAYAKGHDLENSYIKAIGMEIVAKCKGVPLAIRTLGSVLYFKNPEKEWLSFKDNELSKVAQKENDILPILKLSYNHLPSYLKQCFAYCCLFPKNYKIHKPTLIKMWMAQGFIRSSSQNQCLEDIGHDYFMELLWRSFFQEDEQGDTLKFKVHDLMHNLVKLVVAFDTTTFYSNDEDIHEKTLHVSFDRTFLSLSRIPISLYKACKIRTFHLPSQLQDPQIGLDKTTYNLIILSFKFIRLLDLHGMGIETIPNSIGKLNHLRYLDLSHNHIRMLPNSITRLHNLQTLRLSRCPIKELPKDINKLVNLRYLEIDGCPLTYMPHGLRQLTKLRTLSQFVIGKNSYLAFKRNSGLKELYKLNELRETLEIKGLRHGKDAASESKGANMKEKQHLQGLKLWWQKEDVDESDIGYDEESLEALHPYSPSSNLQQLHVIRYMGVKFPSGISLLSTLVDFSLFNCHNCQYLPPLDQFHSLKSLSLELLNDLEYISERDYNRDLSDSLILPSLQKLQIHNCPKLKGWWQQQRDSIEKVNNHSLPSFPRLSNLYISVCLKLTSMPLFPNLEKLKLGICSLKPLEQTMSMEGINMTTSRSLTSTFSSSTLATSSFMPLSKLKSMSIEHMVETLPKELMCNLISLQVLTIKYCCGPLPLSRHLTALQNLRIIGCEEFDLANNEDEMEWHGLQSLRHLMFNHLPNLATLPVGIQYLTSLQTLEIYHCRSLMTIPEWICNLTSLQTLKILSCPILLERCKRRDGEDW
ncbi:hypothetical protein ACB092_03G162800, partial [Castanea dentata]